MRLSRLLRTSVEKCFVDALIVGTRLDPAECDFDSGPSASDAVAADVPVLTSHLLRQILPRIPTLKK